MKDDQNYRGYPEFCKLSSTWAMSILATKKICETTLILNKIGASNLFLCQLNYNVLNFTSKKLNEN